MASKPVPALFGAGPGHPDATAILPVTPGHRKLTIDPLRVKVKQRAIRNAQFEYTPFCQRRKGDIIIL